MKTGTNLQTKVPKREISRRCYKVYTPGRSCFKEQLTLWSFLCHLQKKLITMDMFLEN